MEVEDQGEVGASHPMEEEAAALLHQLGYLGPLCARGALLGSCGRGAACARYTALCVWLVSELKAVCPLVDDVCPTEGPQDADAFQVEMSGLLGELHCPYPSLTAGDVTSRLTCTTNCLLALVFLGTELQAARILACSSLAAPDPGGPSQEAPATPDPGGLSQEAPATPDPGGLSQEAPATPDPGGLSQEAPAVPDPGGPSHEALCELRLAGEALGLPEPSPGVSLVEFIRSLEPKVRDLLGTGPGARWSPPLLTAPLLPAQWESLAELHRALCAQYERRMKMLTTRFNVTIQSFHWSERAKDKGSAMEDVLWQLRHSLREDSSITLSHVLAAREDDSRILQTCSATVCQKTNSPINKVLMLGHVPDRGGRPNEIEPPMPAWEKRREGGARGRNPRGKKKQK
uniref:Family with sequence similarity 98 member C n=1 Tax=Leptobrachium leishanense TaxID=445787 RepID=A0A8C5PTF0_9ANUR